MSTTELPEWRGKYANVNPFDKLHEQEPFFFMRAQDVTAPGGVEAYANTLIAAAAVLENEAERLEYATRNSSTTRELTANEVQALKLKISADRLRRQSFDCFSAAEAMRVWQKRNPTLVKIPD